MAHHLIAYIYRFARIVGSEEELRRGRTAGHRLLFSLSHREGGAYLRRCTRW
jgi:hypothetical protein